MSMAQGLLLSGFFFFSSRRGHTRCYRDWSSDVCSSDLVEVLWDELLPEGATALPEDLHRIDEALSDPAMLAPFKARFETEAAELSTDPLGRGRPTISMATYLRLMVIKHRTDGATRAG